MYATASVNIYMREQGRQSPSQAVGDGGDLEEGAGCIWWTSLSLNFHGSLYNS